MTVAKDFEEFFASFNKSGVQYLVVGGYAFALHAHPRYTGDMDVFIQASEENARRVMEALLDFGFAASPLSWEGGSGKSCPAWPAAPAHRYHDSDRWCSL